MKISFIAVLIIAVSFIYASLSKSIMQIDCSYVNFDNSTSNQCITICNNSIWQIGSPQKTIFTSPFSPPNVIVTDTANPYPASDTSCFLISVPLSNYPFIMNSCFGNYWVHSDSLTDFCTIEI